MPGESPQPLHSDTVDIGQILKNPQFVATSGAGSAS
jgi:hypothetical protein